MQPMQHQPMQHQHMQMLASPQHTPQHMMMPQQFSPMLHVQPQYAAPPQQLQQQPNQYVPIHHQMQPWQQQQQQQLQLQQPQQVPQLPQEEAEAESDQSEESEADDAQEESESSDDSESDSSAFKHKRRKRTKKGKRGSYKKEKDNEITRSSCVLATLPKVRLSELVETMVPTFDSSVTAEWSQLTHAKLIWLCTRILPRTKITDLRVRSYDKLSDLLKKSHKRVMSSLPADKGADVMKMLGTCPTSEMVDEVCASLNFHPSMAEYEQRKARQMQRDKEHAAACVPLAFSIAGAHRTGPNATQNTPPVPPFVQPAVQTPLSVMTTPTVAAPVLAVSGAHLMVDPARVPQPVPVAVQTRMQPPALPQLLHSQQHTVQPLLQSPRTQQPLLQSPANGEQQSTACPVPAFGSSGSGPRSEQMTMQHMLAQMTMMMQAAQQQVQQHLVQQHELPQQLMGQGQFQSPQQLIGQQQLPQQSMDQQQLLQQELGQQHLPQQLMGQQQLPQQEMGQQQMLQQQLPQQSMGQQQLLGQQHSPQQEMEQQHLPQQGMGQQQLPRQELDQQHADGPPRVDVDEIMALPVGHDGRAAGEQSGHGGNHEAHDEDSDRACVICHEAMVEAAEDLEALVCRHVYHSSCIRHYMQISGKPIDKCCPMKCYLAPPFVEADELEAGEFSAVPGVEMIEDEIAAVML